MNRARTSDKGSVGGVIFLLVVVAVLLGIGLTTASRGWGGSDEPTCDGKVMRPGDRCISFGNPGLGGSYEEMKARVPGNKRGDRVAAGASFTLVGVVLLAALVSRRRGRRADAIRTEALGDRTAPEVAGALVAEQDLGQLVQREASGKKAEHFRHAHGLVLDTEHGPVAFPYRDLSIYRIHEPNLSRQGDLVTSWRFERRDGRTWQTMQRNNEPLARLFEQGLAATCAVQREVAVQRLAEGRSVTFGSVEFDLSQLSFGGQLSGLPDTVSWAAVKRIWINKGTDMMVDAHREGRFVKTLLFKVANIGEVPNFPLLWSLANQAHTAAGQTPQQQ